MKTTQKYIDGKILKIYSSDNTYLGQIYTDVNGQFIFQGDGSDTVYFGDGSSNNIILDGGGIINANGLNTIQLGVSGDTIQLGVSGVSYLIDLSYNSRIVLPTFSSDPTGYKKGQIYYNTSDDNIYKYNGSSWILVG